jgi:tetratricopeptide (TPR) repeat protein
MSLINDALKEAQRERSGRANARREGPFVESIFPYPDARKKAWPPILFIGGAAIVVAAGLVAGIVARNRLRASAPKTPAPIVKVAPTIPKSTPTTVASSGTVSSTSTSATKAPPVPAVEQSLSRPAAKPAILAHAPAPRPATDRGAVASAPTSKLRADSAAPSAEAANRRAASAPTLPEAPTASRGDASGVRLVLDASGNGPADSLFRLAYAEQMKNNLDGAQALYEKAIATRHARAEAYNDYGVLLLARGNKTAATEMFRQALNRDDKNVEAWVNMGDSFNGMGYHAEAMSAYARANQLDPTRAAVKARISREYEAIGDTTSARRYLEEAVKGNPSDASAHYALGAYLQRMHDFPGAIREFQAFVDLSPAQDGQEFVSEMRRHISALKKAAP